MIDRLAYDLLDFVKVATTPYHAVEESIKRLKTAGFLELKISKPWELQVGGSYYINAYGTSLFAFTVGKCWEEGQNLRIAAAHTDHPGFRIKPHSEMISGEYLKLDTEMYGGPILNTWLDRPLSAAGRIALRSKDPFHPELRIIDMKKPILTIPNMAIHINREVNKGFELNNQIDMIPLFAMKKGKEEDKQFLLHFLSDYLQVKPEEILDYDLYVYAAEEGCLLGMEEEFISCPRLDNLTSVYALLKGIIEGRREEGINLIALYDNEEIGSVSKQGADSSLLNMLIKKIYSNLGSQVGNNLCNIVDDSMLLSVDVAQGLHPNHPEKYDPNNQAFLNEGFAIKIDSNQKYTFDTEAVAIVQQICEGNEIKYQKYVNRSDMPGGRTLGPIISSWLPIKTVDIGIPLLAMHSARETMGVKDQNYLENFIYKFFEL